MKKRMAELQGLPASEQVKKLKILINEQENQQRMLQTKSRLLEREQEKADKRLQEAQNVKPQSENIQQQAGAANGNKDVGQIQKLLAGTLLSNQGTLGDKAKLSTGSKPEQANKNVCICGDRDPQYRGYCRACLLKLKSTFDRCLEKFRLVQDEYDQYTSVDTKTADEKIRLMKNKIEQYQIKLSEFEIVDVIDKHQKLSQASENRSFAEFKAQVSALKQELAISKARHAIELEDLRKQADYLETQKIRAVGQQREVEVELEKLKDTNIKVKK